MCVLPHIRRALSRIEQLAQITIEAAFCVETLEDALNSSEIAGQTVKVAGQRAARPGRRTNVQAIDHLLGFSEVTKMTHLRNRGKVAGFYNSARLSEH
jgi:hypothetical protein